ADVVLIAGTPLDFRLGHGAGIGEEAKIIQIDSDASEIGRNPAVEVGLLGGSRRGLEQIGSALPAQSGSSVWLDGLRSNETRKAAKQAEFETSSQVPVHHFRLARELDAVARGCPDALF